MKKKLFSVLTIALMLFPAAVLAEGNLPTEPFTWEYLVTILGATAATLIFVQILKLPLDKVWKIPTRIVVYFIALIILETALYFTTGFNASSAILAIFNAGIVALAAMGAYEVTFRSADDKKKQEAAEE